MTTRSRDESPQTWARLGGLFYLVIIVFALFGEVYVRGKLIVRGDAAATAANIVGSEALFRVGTAGEVLTCVLDVAVATILYVLVRPMGRIVALLSLMMRVTFVVVYAVSKFFLLAAPVLLGGANDLQAFEPRQLQSLAYASVRMHGYAYGLSLVFFGCSLFLVGYLIRRSGYLPAILGVLLLIAGACYVIHSFVQIVDPALAGKLFPWSLLPAFPAELGLALWLLFKGVEAPKWEASAAVAAQAST
jgi:hypothetical protein